MQRPLSLALLLLACNLAIGATTVSAASTDLMQLAQVQAPTAPAAAAPPAAATPVSYAPQTRPGKPLNLAPNKRG